ncbi:MAG: chemotaxis protein CheB, partial [Alcanivorax sp.]|nr:chemotaxis protein CheB [Alcanivorax sp.]
MAVILTGANDDGAAGCEYIRRRGGITIAQSPVSSEAPVMPEAAIRTGMISSVLDLEKIGPFLAEHVTG